MCCNMDNNFFNNFSKFDFKGHTQRIPKPMRDRNLLS